MWNMSRYPKPHKFASCDGDGMAPWPEVRNFDGNLGKFDHIWGIFCDILAYLTDIFDRARMNEVRLENFLGKRMILF